MLRFAVAPTGFKECLDAEAVAEAIGTGIRRVVPGALIDTAPLIDGGEGSARQLARSTGGELVPVEVTGPVGDPVRSHFALLGPRTAFVELAAAAGLSLVPADRRDPGRTTSRGVGELVAAALDAGAEKIIIGCGDSGICDGGAGALRALGARVLDASGDELPEGGAALSRTRRIDTRDLDARIRGVDLVLATNPRNLLDSVARVFGPQKGATAEQVEELSAAMRVWGDVLRRHSGTRFGRLPGSGASGGLGAGLAGVLGASLRSRFDVLLDAADVERRLAAADLVITGEGAIDASTALGKIPAEVARLAKRHGKPVVAIAGTIGAGADTSYDTGIDAIAGILTGPVDLADAISRAPELIAAATARTLRMLLLGRALAA
ncbi:glycerate kinase [Saccharopolyspora taberi]|uniref:Glycerate kinase n=1 Tax=Saccharopolyspora taberi TaxID=60895 RepID=A0ABN3VN09_9PSEU